MSGSVQVVVSGSPDVCNSFVSESGWWCPALRMSPLDLSPLLAILLSPSLAGGVRFPLCLLCLPPCSRFVFRLPSPGGLCLLQLPTMFFHLSLPPIVFHLSPSCVPVVFQMQLPRCFPAASSFSACCLVVFHVSPGCGLPVVF